MKSYLILFNLIYFSLFLLFKFRYLIPINLPPEALANPTIAQLQTEYLLVMNEFKEAHKQHQKSLKENSKLRELRSDIEIIDAERGNGNKTKQKKKLKKLTESNSNKNI